ncbi:MAG: alpha/beta hydrolase [Akkermansiaceae bacterium]|nr:alpha/beta hydrolase [Akkermansiaceae bacterium]
MKPILLLVALAGIVSAQYKDLWPTEAPGDPQRAAGSEKANDHGHLSQIEAPQYQTYLPEKDKATGAAVVILPGGGYGIVAIQHEGHELAKWFAERGVVGVVVKYRVPNQFPTPFLDARRAIRTVRANADAWGVDPKKVGIMGFSAGGHLASLCTTRFNDTFPEQENRDEIDKLSARPDFSMLIYPVISMGPVGHGGSRKNLLGPEPTPEQIEKYSTEKAVTPETPPVFLLSTADDAVDCRNSLSFAAACKENKVPVTLHLFETGGHGYGLHGKGELAKWPMLLEGWLKAKGHVK